MAELLLGAQLIAGAAMAIIVVVWLAKEAD